jgi:hypothetical protein
MALATPKSIRSFAKRAVGVLCAVPFLFFAQPSGAQSVAADAPHKACTVKPVEFDGWQAQQLTNDYVTLTFVPELGGRLMQVVFAGHPYLFVNPQFKGKYFPPPANPKGTWYNYGGDKLWPMPEGEEDADHWPGPIADQLDDGSYTFTSSLYNDNVCTVTMASPHDAPTGLQFSRQISVAVNSPEIHFRATMINASDHTIHWSMQSVSQYELTDPENPSAFNKNFWAFTPVNPDSAYFTSFQVRAGLADDPSFQVKDGLFSLHWLYLQNEVWLDSPAGWVAVLDRTSHFAMVERFQYQERASYPGKATVIFYKNGPSFGSDKNGMPSIHSDANGDPFYMEAELNSPIVKLAPRESYEMDTAWFPTRTGDTFQTVAEAGVVEKPLALSSVHGSPRLTGTFGVFYDGTLTAIFYDKTDKALARTDLGPVRVDELAVIDQATAVPPGADHLELHLLTSGIDRGKLGEIALGPSAGGRS